MKKTDKTIAFYIEALLLTLLLLVCLTVLVQLFGSAQAMGAEAKQTTEAVLVAKNAAALFEAGSEEFAALPAVGETATTTLFYNNAGALVPAGGKADYTVTAALHADATPSGRLVSAELGVTETDATQGKDLCTVEVKKYIPE